MKCRECSACHKGWFPSKPDSYVCIGVPEPFVIDDINHECTEYPEKVASDKIVIKSTIAPVGLAKPYVGDDGIYVASDIDLRCHKMLISKELFVEAYNKWIKGE